MIANVAVVGSFHTLFVAHLAKVFCRYFESGLTVGLEPMDGFHMSLHVFPHSVGVFPNESTRRDRACVLKRQAQRSNVGKHSKAVFLADEARWRIEDAAFDAFCRHRHKAIGVRSHLNHGDVLVRGEPDPLERETSDKVGNGTKPTDGDRAAF